MMSSRMFGGDPPDDILDLLPTETLPGLLERSEKHT